jgi:hypothetical protein
VSYYTYTSALGERDTRPTGDPAKIISGSLFDFEFEAIQTGIAALDTAKADKASPTFTGTSTFASVDISGGNIDATIIGATTAAAGSFSTLSVSGGITGNLTGNVTGDVTGDVAGSLTGNVTGDVTGDLTGTVLTASQPNITSVGTLTSLDVSGNVTGGNLNISNWDTAYDDKINSVSFNTSNGVLTLTQEDGTTLTQDLDGRYSTTDTNTTYTAGNGLNLSGTVFSMSGSYTGTFSPTAISTGAGSFSGNITGGVWSNAGTPNSNAKFEVVSALPGSPDANTVYFVT